MNNSFVFIVGALAGAFGILCIVLLLLPAVMTSPVPAESYETAVKKCENNDGLKEFSYNSKGYALAVCKNGAKFDFRWKE